MIVCIAEKPSVAKDIANVLGAKTSRDGYMEGNGYQVTWTFGHLCELKEPHEYTPNWKAWSLSSLPMIPDRFGIKLKADKGIEKQFKTIQHLMQQADMIINCGDAGQEGELIQRWVMQKAGAKCPVKRLWISSLTEEAIKEGFKALKNQDEYQSLYEAGLSRAIGDWTLGMNATRLYTLKYGQNRQVLSIGRVQTPTLALIVKRQQEIENFVPNQSWVLSTLYRDTKFTAIVHDEEAEAEAEAEIKEAAAQGKTIKPKGPVFKQLEYQTEEEGLQVLNFIKEQPFTVTNIQKKKGTEAPPRLYDLTSLQVDCNRKFGFSADMTLQLIQSLYEKKFTTYPRVDTTFLSDDIYPKCPRILSGLRGYDVYTQPLAGKTLPKSKKVFDSSKVTDHHAIIPTGVPAQNMNDMEAKVYDLIARSFIAVFYPDCKFETTTVMGQVPMGEDQVLFRTSGKTILEEGWKVIFKKKGNDADVEEKTEEEHVLPAFSKGENGPHVPSLYEKWTQPPKPYTEATLLRAMETAGKFVDSDELRDALKENGIGRPSTRAAIIETLFKRHYIRKERRTLWATPTGVELIGLIHEELLKSAELTGLWEKKLRQIESKSYSAQTFIVELKEMVTDIIRTVLADNTNRRVSVTTEDAKPTRKTRNSGGTPRARKPKDKGENEGTAVAPTQPESPVRPVTGTAPLPLQAPPVGQTCPVCGKGVIIKGRTAYGCSNWKEGCNYRIPFGSVKAEG